MDIFWEVFVVIFASTFVQISLSLPFHKATLAALLLWSEKHPGSFRKNNNLSKNVIVNALDYIRLKKALFCSRMAVTGVASAGGKEQKEKKEVRACDQEPAALSHRQKPWPKIREIISACSFDFISYGFSL